MSSSEPKISIITACYNAEKTIEQTIQSVVNQTYSNIEYIIIDGASTDKTMEIVNKYYNNIDVIVSESDEGIYDAFNKGIRISSGDYINFMNSDDFFSNDNIVEKVASQLNANLDIKMLHGNVRAFDEQSGHWHFRGESLKLSDFEKGKMCPHQSVFTHKSLFTEFQYFDLKYKILADVDFTIKCFKNYENQIVYLPMEIAYFRIGGMSSSLKYDKNLHEENAELHLYHFGTIPKYTHKCLLDYEGHYANELYKMWLEKILIRKEGVSEEIKDRNVAIFGTKKNATLLYHYLSNNGVDIKCFLDNDKKMRNKSLHEKPIVSPDELTRFTIDVIVISIERVYAAEEIKNLLYSQFPTTRIFVWHELV